MYKIVLVTTREQELEDFSRALAAEPEGSLRILSGSDELLELVRADKPHLVILDEQLANALDLVVSILKVDAMVNTTMITSMDEKTWHDKSEGLGMMHPVSDPPGAGDAQKLLTALRSMPGLR
jgi:DNA-binding response OmpR family regulator